MAPGALSQRKPVFRKAEDRGRNDLLRTGTSCGVQAGARMARNQSGKRACRVRDEAAHPGRPRPRVRADAPSTSLPDHWLPPWVRPRSGTELHLLRGSLSRVSARWSCPRAARVGCTDTMRAACRKTPKRKARVSRPPAQPASTATVHAQTGRDHRRGGRRAHGAGERAGSGSAALIRRFGSEAEALLVQARGVEAEREQRVLDAGHECGRAAHVRGQLRVQQLWHLRRAAPRRSPSHRVG